MAEFVEGKRPVLEALKQIFLPNASMLPMVLREIKSFLMLSSAAIRWAFR